MTGRLDRAGVWALCGTLLALVFLNVPELGSDPWPFRPGAVEPEGPLAPLVRAADREWDLGIPRTAAFLAGLLVALAAAAAFRARSWPRWTAVALALVTLGLLLAPATLLQTGLRQATAPWFHTNDSTYQIEIAGRLLREGANPYGHDYSASGLERFYTHDGTVSPRILAEEPALRHLAYFPGSPLTGAAWSALPAPFDDYRVLVLLCTLGLFGVALAFPAPLGWRLAIGAALAGNPIAVRSAWFGQNDAPSLLFLALALALVLRARYGWAATSLAAAVLLKQFALVAVPFLAVMLLVLGVPRAQLKRAAAAFAAVLAAGIVPFLAMDPKAFLDDSVLYGAETYRIVGYGLSAILLNLDVIDDRLGPYPFVPLAILIWLPLTVWLLRCQRRSDELWPGVAAFTLSLLVLMWLGRTFNHPYLLWPLAGIGLAVLTAISERFKGVRRPS